jgi:hypothetical protein
VTTPAPGLDRLGLLAARDAASVSIGGTDVRPVMFGANLHEAMSQLPRADLKLREPLARGMLIDYLAPVAFQVPSARRAGPRFVGDVIWARPDGEDIAVELSGMPQLTESQVGLFATWNVPHQEHVYALMRAAGLTDDQLNIEGLDTLPREVFEVIVPIGGLVVQERTELAEVTLIAPASVIGALKELTDDADLIEPFERADCVAICDVCAALMFDAEQQAIANVDSALEWLAVTLRYGAAHWPGGRPRRFERAEFRALPQRGELTWVRGVVNARQWIRGTGPVSVTPRLDLRPRHLDLQPPASFSVQDHQAVQALRRVSSTTDPIQAVTAIWDAIEFYVAGISGPQLFDDRTLKKLRKAIPKDLPAPLRGRAIDAINRLNQMPLLTRLRAAAEEEGVPTNDDEWGVLQRLRRSRNALVHGASANAGASASDLQRAQSLVARLLVYRAHRLRES